MAPGFIWIDRGQIAEGSSGTRAMVFTVRRTGGTDAFAVGYNTADFTARAADGDYVPVAGVLQFGVGVESMTVEVPVNGDGKLENAEWLYLQLSSPTNGAAFGRHPGDGGPPIGLSYGVIRNDDHLSVPGEVWVNDTSVIEGTGGTRELVFTVMRTGTVAFDVDFATSSGSDFEPKAGTLHFAEGVMSQTVSVTVFSDAILESSKWVELTLRNATNGMKLDYVYEWTDGPESSGSGVVLDDDANPGTSYISINDVVVVEGNSGTKQVALTVTRSGGSGAFTVDFETAGDDVVRDQGTLSFAAGEYAKTILVTVNGDRKYEPYDGFAVVLSNAVGAEIIKDVGHGQITNDDPYSGAGIVFIGDATMVEGASGTRALTFSVSRSQGTGAFTVDYTTRGYTGAGTATMGTDFVATSGGSRLRTG